MKKRIFLTLPEPLCRPALNQSLYRLSYPGSCGSPCYNVKLLITKYFKKKSNEKPVVLYGCETWSLTLREEDRLRVFENRVLRRIFEPKRDEVTGGWRK
jgi:hypothetical protein